MPVYDGINGVVRKRKEWPVGINGVVRQQKEHWAGIGGVKRMIHGVSEKTAGSYSVGSVVNLTYATGETKAYTVVHQGTPNASMYSGNCNGTWLLSRKISLPAVFGDNNRFSGSKIFNKLNRTFYNSLSESTKAAIQEVKIPHMNTAGSLTVSSGVSGLSCKVFLLSAAEIGLRPEDSTKYVKYTDDGVKLSFFEYGMSYSANKKRIAESNGDATFYWLRSQAIDGISYAVIKVADSGSYITYGNVDPSINTGFLEAVVIDKNTKFNSVTNTII